MLLVCFFIYVYSICAVQQTKAMFTLACLYNYKSYIRTVYSPRIYIHSTSTNYWYH